MTINYEVSKFEKLIGSLAIEFSTSKLSFLKLTNSLLRSFLCLSLISGDCIRSITNLRCFSLGFVPENNDS